MKIKLSMALIGISSIHLLKTFINADNMKPDTIQWQVIIHLVFVVSSVALAYIAVKLSHHPEPAHPAGPATQPLEGKTTDHSSGH